MQLVDCRILLIEDEGKVAEALREGLTREGGSVQIATTGESGFFEAQTRSFDVILLDWNLPGRNGMEILRALRGLRMPTPVIFLTARDAVDDRVLGLEAGADDYLSKPFAFPELVARIKALIRRGNREQGQFVSIADLLLHPVTRAVRRGETPIRLTAKETDLLMYLMRHRDTVVTRAMIARDVWQETQRATPLDNVVDVHVAHLRKKIDDGHSVKLLHTIRGVGFLLSETKP